MTADPVQVLVTIHPREDRDWCHLVADAVTAVLSPDIVYGVEYDELDDLVRPEPHGEAKAHREAAEAALESAQLALAHVPALAAQTHSLAAIAHALLALGERP